MPDYKPTFFDYDATINTEPLDEVVVCLDDREQRLLLALLEPARWRTRWYNGVVDKDQLETFVDGLAAKISKGCAMELRLDACGLYLNVGGVDVSAVDLTQCVDFYSLQLDQCALTLYESGEPKNTIDLRTLADCIDSVPPAPVIDICNAAWALAQYMQSDFAAFYGYDLQNGPFPSKQNFVFTFRTEFPQSIFALMPAGNAVDIANAWDVPNQLTYDVLSSSGAGEKLAEVAYCALTEADANAGVPFTVTNIRLLLQKYLEQLEFWQGEIFDVAWQFINNLPYSHFDYMVQLGIANGVTGDCTGFDCDGGEELPFTLIPRSNTYGILNHLGGTRYRIQSVWLTSTTPDAEFAGVAEKYGRQFIISNMALTGIYPQTATSADGDCNSPTFTQYGSYWNGMEGLPVCEAYWSHSQNVYFEIEFDAEMVV